MTAVSWLTRNVVRYKAERRYRHLQLVSARLYSLGHGTNDAQKTMGIIVLLLKQQAMSNRAKRIMQVSRDWPENTRSHRRSSSVAKAVFTFRQTLDRLNSAEVPNLYNAKMNVLESVQEVFDGLR